MKNRFRIASSLTRYAGAALGIVVFAACGGVNDPGLFSASGATDVSGSSNHGGSLADGESARGGAAKGGESSFGGSDAAGGSPSKGGAAAGASTSAGSSSAGASGSGHAGASGSAGASPGSGGSGGSGGATGGAANGGNGGSITNAGNGGSGGSITNAGNGGSGGGGETCQTLLAKASKQLAAAQACNYAADALQCTGTVNNLCNCGVAVNRKDSAETKAYEATLAQLEKKPCMQACTAVACVPATHSTCVASAPGSVTGTCVGMFANPF